MAFKLAEAFVEITGRDAKFKQAARSTETAFAASVKRIERNATRIGVALTAVGAGITAAFATAIRTTASFQQSMANTQSVLGGTSKDLQRLTGFAREMGKQSVFSATESANAMYFLASAGFDTEKIMKSLRGTLLLAAATQSDLAFTSGTVAATLSAFGLEAKDADRIANVFAATIASSQATMERLATSMSFVAPVARSVGLSLEDTTSILGSLFNAGIDASTAGTALRQSIAQLLKPSGDATAALDRLGVTVLNTSGNLRPMIDIIRDLEVAGLSTADAMSIFGIRAGPAMLALVNKGADAIENLTKKVTDTNKAATAAEIQIGTFQGQLKLLKSAFQELQIAIGTTLLPTLTEYVQKITEVINKTSEWAKEHERLAGILSKSILGFGIFAALTGSAVLLANAVGGFSLLAKGAVVIGGIFKLLAIDVSILAGRFAALSVAGKSLNGIFGGIAAGIGTLAVSLAGGILGTLAGFAALFGLINRETKKFEVEADVFGVRRGTKDIADINAALALYTRALEQVKEAQDKGAKSISLYGTVLKRADGTMQGFDKDIRPVQTQIERLEDRIADLTKRLQIANGVFVEFDETLVTTPGIIGGLFAPIDKLIAAGDKLTQSVIDVAGKFTLLREEMDFLTPTTTRAIQNFENLEAAVDSFGESIGNIKDVMDEAVNILPDEEGGRRILFDPESMDELIARLTEARKEYLEFARSIDSNKIGLALSKAFGKGERVSPAFKAARKAALEEKLKEIDRELAEELRSTAAFNANSERVHIQDLKKKQRATDKASDERRSNRLALQAELDKINAEARRKEEGEIDRERNLRQSLLDNLTDSEKQFYRKITGFQGTFVSRTRQELEKVKTLWANAGKEIETGVLAGFIEFRNNLPDFKDHTIDVLNDIQGAFTNLFEDLFSGNTKDLWSQFWDDLKSIAIRKLAEIAANEVFKQLGMGDTETKSGGTESAKDNIFDVVGSVLKSVLIKLGVNAVTGGTASAAGITSSSVASSTSFGPPGSAFAEGGIVRRPTLATIGEAGAEAVIPLRGGRVPVELTGGGRSTIVIESMPISFPNANLDNIDDTMLEKNMTRMIPHIQRAIDGGEIKIA